MSSSNNRREFNGQDCAGKEIFEIHPVVLGGSPTETANKVVLDRKQHMEAVVYWNRLIRELRSQGVSSEGD